MTSSEYPSNPNKQLQLMMNLSLLSSLKQKQPLPQIPQVTYVQPPPTSSNPLDYLYRNTSTPAQPLTVTQMSYHSIYSPHSTILSYKRDDTIDLNAHVAYTPHYYLHTSNPSHYHNHKSYTAMSYNIPHNIYQQQQQQPFSYAQVPSLSLNDTNTNYIGHKTTRNNVILSNTTTDNNINDINDLMSNANESSIVGNNANTIINSNNSCNKMNNNSNKNSLLNLYLQDNVISNTHSLISKPIIKHHSAPIKLLHTHSGVFETHCFLKTQSESNNNSDEHNEGDGSDKKYKCGHLTCELTYKTKKQKVAHHAKMDLECQKDTINHLKLISELKNMILHLLMKKKKIKNDKTFQKLNQKFKQTMHDISLSEYAEMICGKVIYSSTPQHAKYLNNIGYNNS